MLPENQNPNQNPNQSFPRPPQVSRPPQAPQPLQAPLAPKVSVEDRLFQAKGVRLMENDIKEATYKGGAQSNFDNEAMLPENKFELLDDDIDIPESSDYSRVKVIAITSAVVVLVLLIVGGVYWFINSNDSDDQESASEETVFVEPEPDSEPEQEVPVVTPIPTVEPVVTPITEPVVTPEPEPIEIAEPVASTPTSLINGIDNIVISLELETGETRHLVIKTTDTQKGFLSFQDFSEIMELELPEEVSLNAVNWSVYLYQPQKQEISFCQRLKINKSGCSGPRLSLVVDLDSMGDYEFKTKVFEKEVAPSLSGLILAKISKSKYSFSNANYKKWKLRYKNYPILPSKKTTSITSIDYLTYQNSGNNLLVVSTSRLSFYALLDKIKASQVKESDEDKIIVAPKKSIKIDKLDEEVIDEDEEDIDEEDYDE